MQSVIETLSKQGIVLKDHQKEAIQWMKNVEDESEPYGGILADDMGLGKTLEALSLTVANPVKRTLIIVPASVLEQWIIETVKFLGEEVVDNLSIDEPCDGYTFTTFYKAAKRDIIQSELWDRVIIDEGHIIRNRKTMCFKGIKRLKARHKWVLSGTPIQNSIADLKTLLMFVGFSLETLQNEELLLEISDLHILRRTKDEVEMKMPNLRVLKYFIEFETEEERKQYASASFNLKMKKSYSGENCLLTKYLRLRQFTLLPKMVFESLAKDCQELPKKLPKSYKLDRIVKVVAKEKDNERPIIFCHFKKEMHYLKERLEYQGIKTEIINGDVSQLDRLDIINRHESYHALLIQLQAGSVGLNLQMFNTVIFTAPHWNPTHERQAICRAYRLGQDKNVTVRRFAFKDTIENLIINRQKLKNQVMKNFNMHAKHMDIDMENDKDAEE